MTEKFSSIDNNEAVREAVAIGGSGAILRVLLGSLIQGERWPVEGSDIHEVTCRANKELCVPACELSLSAMYERFPGLFNKAFLLHGLSMYTPPQIMAPYSNRIEEKKSGQKSLKPYMIGNTNDYLHHSVAVFEMADGSIYWASPANSNCYPSQDTPLAKINTALNYKLLLNQLRVDYEGAWPSANYLLRLMKQEGAREEVSFSVRPDAERGYIIPAVVAMAEFPDGKVSQFLSYRHFPFQVDEGESVDISHYFSN